ncbi:hypothetical protein GCM10010104_50750 [Streptomyces indiaensis]|uniref:Uncharacterized protein n=1 Tax=Streptomyces indiaensis TaxID=284033 RepID=A0ABN3E4S9_9ACTN
MTQRHCGCGTPWNTLALACDRAPTRLLCTPSSGAYPAAPNTSGALSACTLCTEAGISRATYYRSPLAKIITGLLRTPDAPRPQTDTLTADISRLKRPTKRCAGNT